MSQSFTIILILALARHACAQNHDDDQMVNHEIKGIQVNKMGAEMVIPEAQKLDSPISEAPKDVRFREPRPTDLDEYPHAELNEKSRKPVDPGRDINDVIAQHHLDLINDQKFQDGQLDQIQREFDNNLKRAGLKEKKINLRNEIKKMQSGDQ